jgi:alanine dehydrogenase
MPGAVPRTSTYALTNVTLPYALTIANKGVVHAVREDKSLRAGVNTYRGRLTSEAVAASQGKEHTPVDQLI